MCYTLMLLVAMTREGKDHFGNFIRTAYWYVRPPRAIIVKECRS
jgi:hypothetical protein